jgi:putative redox protein
MAVRIEAIFQGGLAVAATHGPSGDVLHTDAPKDNQGEGKHFSPTDLLATAILTCMITTMAIAARGRGHTLGEVRGSVDKEMSSVPRRHVSRLTVRLTLPASTPEDLREALHRAANHCPVSSSLAQTCEIDLDMTYL